MTVVCKIWFGWSIHNWFKQKLWSTVFFVLITVSPCSDFLHDSYSLQTEQHWWWAYLSAPQRWPIGLDVSVRPGWTPVWDCWVSPDPAETFSSSLLLRQAALGFRLRSAHPNNSNVIFLFFFNDFFKMFKLDMKRSGTKKWHFNQAQGCNLTSDLLL